MTVRYSAEAALARSRRPASVAAQGADGQDPVNQTGGNLTQLGGALPQPGALSVPATFERPMIRLAILFAFFVLPSAAAPALLLFVLRKFRTKPYFEFAWVAALGLVLLWCGAAIDQFMDLARHQDISATPRSGDPIPWWDFLVQELRWLLLYLPSFPALFATFVARRERMTFRVRDILIMMAVIAALISSGMSYWHSQRSPRQVAGDKWLAMGARPTFGKAGQLEGLVFRSRPRLELLGRQEGLKSMSFVGGYINGDDLRYLAEVPNLIELSFGSPKIKDGDLSHLALVPKLRLLSISGPIHGEGLAVLAGLHDLSSLSLNGTAVTDEGLSGLKDAHSLRELSVDRLPLTDRALDPLRGLRQLEALHATKSKITGHGFCPGGFPRLSILTLHDCPVDEAGLRCIVALPAIHSVDMYHTDVTEVSVQKIRQELKAAGANIAIGWLPKR